MDSLLVPIIDFLLIYVACQIGLRYRNISFEGLKSDLRGFPDEYSWILWIAPFLGVFLFSLSNQYRSLFGLFTKTLFKKVSLSNLKKENLLLFTERGEQEDNLRPR